MIKGTTPTHIFNVNIDLTDASVIYITYRQAGGVAVEKALPDIMVAETSLTLTLTQEDTLRFNDGDVEIQIRARFADGSAIASNIMRTTADKVLKRGVI